MRGSERFFRQIVQKSRRFADAKQGFLVQYDGKRSAPSCACGLFSVSLVFFILHQTELFVDQAHKIQIIKLVIVAVIFLISFGVLSLCGFTNIIPKEYYYVIAVSSIFISFLSMFYLVYYLFLKIKMGFI